MEENSVQAGSGTVDWRNSAVREIILDDLYTGTLSLDNNEVSAEEAWRVYSEMPEFNLVQFDQFKRQLKAHRTQVKTKAESSIAEIAALHYDRELYPRPTHNKKGHPIFRQSESQELLRKDMKDGLHKIMSPMELQQTRIEYAQWLKREFKQRIYQEIRYQKFINYLQAKREELFSKETKLLRQKAPTKKRKVDKA